MAGQFSGLTRKAPAPLSLSDGRGRVWRTHSRFPGLTFARRGVRWSMALVRFNPAMEALRGKAGKWVYGHGYRQPVVPKAPNLSGRILSPKPQAQVERFTVTARVAAALVAAYKRACQRQARAKGKSGISPAFQAGYHPQPLTDLPGEAPQKP